jgi:peptidyl-prolyl cis-trans isomerase SurA
MMKLGTFPRAAIVVAASLLSVVAAAQSSQRGSGLNLPDNIQFVGKQEPGVRKATAIVNGDVITESDIDQRLALLVGPSRAQLTGEELQAARAQVLRGLIDETLQIQAAAQQDIVVEDREVDRYYNSMAQEQNQNPQSFAAYLHTIGSSERSLKRQIRGSLAWQSLRGRWIDQFVSVGEDEVQARINTLTASRGTTEYHVAEIFISATPETSAEARANAQRIVQQIRGGAPFQPFARQFSEASTAALGGDLGWVRAEQLPPELAALAAQLPVGAISDPIAVPGGFSILYMVDQRQILVANPRDAVLSLIQLTVTNPAGTTSQQAEARAQQLARATQAMGGCGGAAAVAREQGAEMISNDQMAVRDVPPQLQQLLLSLNVGQATPPFGTVERVSVLVLCGRDDPAAAGAPTPEQVEREIRERRVNARAQRYLRDLRRDAVIDYR